MAGLLAAASADPTVCSCYRLKGLSEEPGVMGHEGIAIGQLSRQTGCNIETIRYYERIGLLPIPARRGRYRLYDREDVGRLAFVRRARALGFTLDEVRALLGLAAAPHDACAEACGIAAAHLANVRSKIADLRAMERVLATAVRRCDAGETAGCPLIDVLGLGSAAPYETCARMAGRPGFLAIVSRGHP